jgi:hypothetical protein
MDKIMIAAIVAALPLSAPLAHEAKGPNGGAVKDAGPYHMELVVKGADLSVFLTDSKDSPVDLAGAAGNAIVLADKKQQSVALHLGGNGLHGHGDFRPAKDLQVVVSVTLPGSKPVQAKFTPGR